MAIQIKPRTSTAFRRTSRVSSEAVKSLPQKYFVSSETFAAEQKKIFSKEWLLVGHQNQIANAGDYFLVTISGESIIVIRDQRSQVRGFYNVCRHRGTRLKEHRAGEAVCGHSSTIQCPYHAWTYGLDGQLMGAPHMDDVPGFDKADYPLHPVDLGFWEGFIFVSLANNPMPLESWFAPLTGKFSHWNMPILRSAKRIEYDVQANWKLMFENYSECYHCPGVHPQLQKISPYDSAENDLREGPFLGGFMKINPGQESDHERKRLRGIRRKGREPAAGFLLFDFPKHASQSAPGICDGASTLAAIVGANIDCLRLVFPSGCGPSRAGSIQSG